MTSTILTSGQQDKIRTALGPELSGHCDQASFSITVTRAGISGVWTNSYARERVGQEQITVDGHAVNTVRLQYHDLGQAGIIGARCGICGTIPYVKLG